MAPPTHTHTHTQTHTGTSQYTSGSKRKMEDASHWTATRGRVLKFTLRSEAASLSHQQPFALSDQRSLVNGAAVVVLAQKERGMCVCARTRACVWAGMQAYGVQIYRAPTQMHVHCFCFSRCASCHLDVSAATSRDVKQAQGKLLILLHKSLLWK